MAASSVTGAGHGAADNTSPPKVKRERIAGAGPRILFAGRAQMIPPQIDIEHPELPSGYNYKTAVILTSTSVERPVAVTARGSEFFSVECDPDVDGGSEFTIFWMVVATGTAEEFM